jgi:hypothetical protein
MKDYLVRNKYKKSVDETEIIVGEVEGVEVSIRYTTNWRSGEFLVSMPETPEEIAEVVKDYGYESEQAMLDDYDAESIVDILMPDEDEDLVEMCDFKDWELLSTWDGCAEDYEIIDIDTEDEEQYARIEDRLTEVLDEEGLWGLFDSLDFTSEDCIYEIHNGIVIEEYDPEKVF